MRSSASRAPAWGCPASVGLFTPLKFPGLHNSTPGAPAPPTHRMKGKEWMLQFRVWNWFMMASLPATWKTELLMEHFAIRFSILKNFCCGFFFCSPVKKDPNPLREADRTETLWCFSSSSIPQKLAQLTECKSLSWSSPGNMDRCFK